MGVIRNLKQAIQIIRITIRKKYKHSSGALVNLSKDVEFTKTNSKLYKENEYKEIILKHLFNTKIKIVDETTTGAIIKRYTPDVKITALNFANATTPGGGFLVGHSAQEESIFRNTIIIPSVLKLRRLYKHNLLHRNKYLYTNHIIFSRKIPVVREDNGSLLKEPVYASFITSPAVFAKLAKVHHISNDKIKNVMMDRIDKILQVAYEENTEILILGAFGCGEFGNNPNIIAKIFYELLNKKYNGCFKEVVFAIYGKNKRNLNIFNNIFNK